MVPKIILKINTANKNTAIFGLLAFKALIKTFDSPIKRVNFKILKTLSKRNALNAIKAWVPVIKSERYFGIVEIKSIIPKKLKIVLILIVIYLIF